MVQCFDHLIKGSITLPTPIFTLLKSETLFKKNQTPCYPETALECTSFIFCIIVH